MEQREKTRSDIRGMDGSTCILDLKAREKRSGVTVSGEHVSL